MKGRCPLLLMLLLWLVSVSVALSSSHRRILHQPLFPIDTTPPPSLVPPPPPPDFSDAGQPFFPEVPNNGPPQNQNPPSNLSAPLPIATQPSNRTKKVAIAVSVGICTLGMLSALGFFLYRHRANHSSQSHKLVTNAGADAVPASELLYLGTMEPTTARRNEPPTTTTTTTGSASASPYHRLNSLGESEFHRPSPELHPLPSLTRPPHNSSSHRTNSSSVASSDDVFYSPPTEIPKQISPLTTTSVKNVIHSRRSSPKSRLSVSSPDVKQIILNTQPTTPSPPKRKPKFQSPPSPISAHTSPHDATTHIPQPPPPPPPPFLVSTKYTSPQTNVPNKPAQSMMPTPTRPIGAQTPLPLPQEQHDHESKPKLKPLHWDKVRATSDRATVWDQFKSSSFHLNEDRIETLFGCNSKTPVKKDSPTTTLLPPMEKEDRVLDPKKSQNIAILLRALNVTRDEVSEALLEGNPDGLSADLLETLVKMAPTKEEELKLRDYNGDLSKLGSAERFLKTVLDIPFAFKRVDAMLYRANFDTEVKYLRKSFGTLEAACEELRNSRLFLKLLEAVLRTGNRMNVGTNRGDAKAFKLDTLLKLLDIKGVDGKTTVLHFVVQEIIRSEAAMSDKMPENLLSKVHPKIKGDDIQKQGLQVVAGLGIELANVKKAAGMDSDVLSSYVSKLEMGLEKVRSVLQYENSNTKGNFLEAMKFFLVEAQEEILRIKTDEKKALYHVKEVTQYFHGDATKEEAHPFRIFMVVRDFLAVLDQVCKEVGIMQEKTIVASARSFRIPASASLPVLNRFNIRREVSSDDESSSP